MNENAASEQTEARKPRPTLRPVGIVLAVIGLLGTATLLADQATLAWRCMGVRSSDAQRRESAIQAVADEREARAFEAVLDAFRRETNRTLLEKAGYALMRMGDRRGIEPLRRRADEGPDDWIRAKLIIYTARLADRDFRLIPWLKEGVRSPEPWRRVGSAIGLLELGRAEVGRTLAEWLPTLTPELRQFALKEFRKRIGEPMIQAAGVSLDWEGLEDAPAEDPRWTQLENFWQARASARLLNDVLTRQDQIDPDRHLMKRLLHARERAERLLF